jgi:hypothetical protein
MVQQYTRYMHKLKEPHAMLKLDITHAFDSIWYVLIFEVLRG